jgi:arylsulfatase A-like enzyme
MECGISYSREASSRRHARCSDGSSAAPTLARLLTAKRDRTGQFAKNHVGDLKKLLPTLHGFDAFLGSLGIVYIDQGGYMDRGLEQVWRHVW